MLRGSRDFGSLEEYKQFLRLWLVQLNAGRRERVKTEMQYLKALPDTRLESNKRVKVRVDSGSVIYVDRNVYSVHSRLIGEQVEARLTAETVEVWYAGQKVEQLPRLRGRGKHRVDYRHIIDWLVRKPGAFSNYRYREELFPTSRFRMTWDALRNSIGCMPTSGTWRFCNWRRWKERRWWTVPCAVYWRMARSVRAS